MLLHIELYKSYTSHNFFGKNLLKINYLSLVQTTWKSMNTAHSVKSFSEHTSCNCCMHVEP